MNGLYIGILTVIIISGFCVLFFYLKKAKADIQRKINQRYLGQNIILREDFANFFGKESLKSRQIRGNGVLVLTKEEIYFSMLMPRKEVIVPLDSIQDIETSTSFLGKTKFKPLLKINFKTGREIRDSAAWLVRDVK
jgi:hypothetical protein